MVYLDLLLAWPSLTLIIKDDLGTLKVFLTTISTCYNSFMTLIVQSSIGAEQFIS